MHGRPCSACLSTFSRWLLVALPLLGWQNTTGVWRKSFSLNACLERYSNVTTEPPTPRPRGAANLRPGGGAAGRGGQQDDGGVYSLEGKVGFASLDAVGTRRPLAHRATAIFPLPLPACLPQVKRCLVPNCAVCSPPWFCKRCFSGFKRDRTGTVVRQSEDGRGVQEKLPLPSLAVVAVLLHPQRLQHSKSTWAFPTPPPSPAVFRPRDPHGWKLQQLRPPNDRQAGQASCSACCPCLKGSCGHAPLCATRLPSPPLCSDMQ